MKSSTEKITYVLLLVGLLSALPLIAQNGGVKNLPVSANSKAPHSVSPLEKEGSALAKQYWAKLLRQCRDPHSGESSYFYYEESEWWRVASGQITQTNRFGGQLRRDGLELTEMKGVSFKFEPHPVTGADILNGITFRAGAEISARAFRTRRIDGPWSVWLPGMDGFNPDGFGAFFFGKPSDVTFWRENGEWKLRDVGWAPGADEGPAFSVAEDLPEMPACDVLQGPAPVPPLMKR